MQSGFLTKTRVGVGLVALSCFLPPAAVAAQRARAAKVCVPSDRWFQCSEKVREAIQATDDVNVALAAASEWADRYEGLYRANAQSSWPWSDQEMLRKAIDKLYDEALGDYLDPGALAFGLALAKYLPRLSAALEFAGSAPASGFLLLLAPTPIANDFVQAGPSNKRINDLLKSKLPPTTLLTIEQRYPELFNKAYIDVRATQRVMKP